MKLMRSFKSTSLVAMAGALLLAACSGPVLPITPDTLAGCWEGDALFGAASARVNIAKGTEVNVYTVNGEAKAAGNSLPINNILIEYNQTSGELKPRTSINLPFKLKVDGAVIRATATSNIPVSMDLKRCAGTPAPTVSGSPSSN